MARQIDGADIKPAASQISARGIVAIAPPWGKQQRYCRPHTMLTNLGRETQ